MYTALFYLIVAIVIFDYVVERLLDYLNMQRMGSALPPELKGIYDTEKYNKQQRYQWENTRFSIISSTFSLILVLGFLFLGGFALLQTWVDGITQQEVLQALIYFAVLMFAQDIVGLPFQLYGTFVIEEKYGFNKTNAKVFVLDKLKGWLLSALIGAPVLAAITWFYYATTNMFWIYAWILVGGFSLFFTLFYSNLIVPLFNKQTPLEDGELRSAIDGFAQKVNFPLKDIYVIDGSKRSTKANAYFTGLGSKKRIVLYDTLINDLSTEEVVAVLAHEVGHYKKKHTLWGIIVSILQMGLLFFLVSLFVGSPYLSGALGIEKPLFHIGIIAFGMLYSPFSTITGLLMNIWSRKNEYQADRFAGDFYKGEHLINALKKMSVNHLSNLTPHPAYIFFYYSHPSLYQRIKALTGDEK